jgi:hypothetical protein
LGKTAKSKNTKKTAAAARSRRLDPSAFANVWFGRQSLHVGAVRSHRIRSISRSVIAFEATPRILLASRRGDL